MTGLVFHEGDNREHLRRLIAQGVRVHSAVMDPPYGLTSIVKRFGKDGAAPAKFGTDGAFSRASAGFMGSKWDATGIERDPEFWRLVYEILLPGGYVLAFSSPRTGHWQACAMELAGFVMHPFKGWVYGQGFPKASNAQRAIDTQLCTLPGRHYESVLPREPRPDDHICPPCTEGAPWAGWAYGTQADKPALEPIYVGQKPFSEKNGALNLLKHGVGAINIDGCRVHAADAQGGEYEVKRLKPGAELNRTGGNWRNDDEAAVYSGLMKPGRHPANLLHDGSAEVVAMFPGQAGALAPVTRRQSDASGNRTVYNRGYHGNEDPSASTFRADSGSAARFFNAFPRYACDDCADTGLVVGGEPGALYQEGCPTCSDSRPIDGTPIRYQGKATKADRAGSKHPTVKPIALMQWLCRMVTPPGGTVLDPFAGTGTTGAAALAEGFDCVLIEADPRYASDIRRRFNLDVALPADIAALLGGDNDNRAITELVG